MFIDVNQLLPGDSPRANGTSDDHIRALAEVETPLPPILVRKQNFQVIDGMHRLAAAKLRGGDKIQAIVLDVTSSEAALLGVSENIAHGLPLSLADRKRSAERILQMSSGLSDRYVGQKTGLSAGTIKKIRGGSPTAQNEQSSMRVGHDGRARPAKPGAAAEHAARALAEDPEGTTAEIAKAAGVSEETVRRVRRKSGAGSSGRAETSTPNGEEDGGRTAGVAVNSRSCDSAELGRRLAQDPAVRMNATGREFVQWLLRYSLAPGGSFPDLSWLPEYYRADVVSVARANSAFWYRVAEAVTKHLDEK